MYNLAIGYACLVIGDINTSLSRCRLKNAADSNLRAIALANLLALEAMIDYNIKQGISLFRISSDIIPFASHPEIEFDWQNEFRELLDRMGSKIKSAGIRVSMHPGQYTVLNSPHTRVVENAAADLQYHAEFLDALSAGWESKIILHVGGVYGDKNKAAASFIENFNRLPEPIQSRLVIENDDKNYSAEDVMEISQVTGIPMVFDNLHHLLNPSSNQLSQYKWIELCRATWKAADGKPKIHYSQEKDGGIRGAHSNTINARRFVDFYNGLPDKNIDIMLEVKDKNLSAIKCMNAVNPDLPVWRLEEEWARYKYLVMSRTASVYKEIRDMLKNNHQVDTLAFYEMIDRAVEQLKDPEAQVIAAQHVWDHLSKNCSDTEKKRYHKICRQYIEGAARVQALKKHLFKCAVNQDVQCLKKSYYFYF